MSNRNVWLLGISLTGIVAVGLLLALPSMLRADSSQDQNSMTASEFASAYKQALISPLNKAAGEVKDPQLAGFTQKLVAAYELDKTGTNVNDQSNLSDLLPDLVKINKTALNMPLKEAGKQIKDKELSEFYDRFITNCGVDK